eukprot:COSAG02_NODE_8630_length_2499_cov_2.346667_3_plen_190_part_00
MWETVAALVVAGEDPTDQFTHGPQRVCLGGPTNLSALQEEIVEWWAGAVRRGQTEIQLVLVAGTAAATSVAPTAGPEQQPIRDAKRSEAAAASTLPSADELVSAVLLFQLMQCLEVEIEPGDEPTRSLLRLVVRSAADGDAGWSRIDAALRAAAVCERERMAVDADSDTTTADLTELLQFDRHSVVPQY